MTKSHQTPGVIGYARVSTVGQTLDAQLDQLKAEGCVRVYREKASGAKADRRQLLRMLAGVEAGDVVTVTRIDRLARSTFNSLPSSSASLMPAVSSALWRNHGQIRRRAQADL
jgi:DNA invertase Pin-like site-specific DNA recombinase